MEPCPLVEVRKALGLSGLGLAQLAGISSTRICDVEAGRVPTIPYAILKGLEAFADTEELVRLHAVWFASLGEEARSRATEVARLSVTYGGNIDGGASPENLETLCDLASSRRK